MELKDFANELTEDKEDKIIEATKISVDELMPKLNEYKKTIEEGEGYSMSGLSPKSSGGAYSGTRPKNVSDALRMLRTMDMSPETLDKLIKMNWEKMVSGIAYQNMNSRDIAKELVKKYSK